jgi:hypothetical protein
MNLSLPLHCVPRDCRDEKPGQAEPQGGASKRKRQRASRGQPGWKSSSKSAPADWPDDGISSDEEGGGASDGKRGRPARKPRSQGQDADSDYQPMAEEVAAAAAQEPAAQEGQEGGAPRGRRRKRNQGRGAAEQEERAPKQVGAGRLLRWNLCISGPLG